MPDITLCTNSTCELRDNCKRALIYNDNKPNQSYQHFEPVKHYFYDRFEYKCEFQLETTKH